MTVTPILLVDESFSVFMFPYLCRCFILFCLHVYIFMQVFSIFEDLGISIDMVATSEVSISLTLDPSKLWSRELIQQVSRYSHSLFCWVPSFNYLWSQVLCLFFQTLQYEAIMGAIFLIKINMTWLVVLNAWPSQLLMNWPRHQLFACTAFSLSTENLTLVEWCHLVDVVSPI